MRFYVYELIDPRTKSAFYVGKGQGNRVEAHEIEAKKGRVSRKYDTIREITAAGLSVIKRKVAFFEDEKSAYAFESLHMASFKNGELTNIQIGGFGGRYSMAKEPSPLIDSEIILKCAKLLHTMVQEDSTKWKVLGQMKDFKEEIEKYLAEARKIASSRGAEWVNKLTKPYGITFEAGDKEAIRHFKTELVQREANHFGIT